VVGPVVAAGEDDAIALVAAAAQAPGFLRLDLPGESRRLAAWATQGGMPEVDAGTAMVRGEALARSAATRCFVLAGQALS
jgi:Acetyltransferase (GNAT) domain